MFGQCAADMGSVTEDFCIGQVRTHFGTKRLIGTTFKLGTGFVMPGCMDVVYTSLSISCTFAQCQV